MSCERDYNLTGEEHVWPRVWLSPRGSVCLPFSGPFSPLTDSVLFALTSPPCTGCPACVLCPPAEKNTRLQTNSRIFVYTKIPSFLRTT